jgi:hypothetical protein
MIRPMTSKDGLSDISGPSLLPQRLRRRLCAWIGVVLLSFNLLAGTGLQAAPPPVADAGDQVICTAGGIVVIHDDGSAPTTARTGDGFCTFCLPLLHGGVAAPDGEIRVEAPVGIRLKRVPPFSRFVPAVHPYSVAAPRAPPSV